MTVKRVLYVLRQYPQITETYMQSEIRTLCETGRYEIDIIALNVATDPTRACNPFRYIPQDDEATFVKAVREMAPDVVHGHELDNVRRLRLAATSAGVPFTVRSHSYDVLGLPDERLRTIAEMTTDDRCLGILAFPFARGRLTPLGFPDHKLHDCWPVVDFDRFHDTSPNRNGIMNIGSCQPKKNMEDFLRLATLLPDRTFRLYAVGFEIQHIRELNKNLGDPVELMPQCVHHLMPAQYKQHEWLVYTASPRERTVGWPIAVAEAQAAGVGVCVQRVRPDLERYVGGAGFLFDRIEEAADVIAKPVPAGIRERGFEQARKSDIREHIRLLEDMWRAA